MALSPGDVVMLKSGGHPMTVVAVDEEDVECVWLGEDGEMFRQSIPAIALTPIDMAELEEEEEAEDADEAEDEDEDEEEDEDNEEKEEQDERRRARRR